MTFPDCSDPGRRRPATRRARRLPALLAGLLASLYAAATLAFEPFVVKDIRVEGVQRTEAGTVFSYLPVKVGERIDDERAAQAVKALFATGFFRDVRLEREGDVLVVIVQERPTISRLEFSGNKEFDTETLRKALREVGLAEARIFDRSALDRAEQEMKRQYITRGLYGAKVTTTVGEISASSQEQTRAFDQLNQAVAQMNGITQQNVANAEESSSAAEEMASQAEELAAMVGRFQLKAGAMKTQVRQGARPLLAHAAHGMPGKGVGSAGAAHVAGHLPASGVASSFRSAKHEF
jgi:hypothetical protein